MGIKSNKQKRHYYDKRPTVIMDKRLDQLAAVQFVVAVRVVHLKVMELQLLLAHLAGVQGHLSVVGNVSGIRRGWQTEDQDSFQ